MFVVELCLCQRDRVVQVYNYKNAFVHPKMPQTKIIQKCYSAYNQQGEQSHQTVAASWSPGAAVARQIVFVCQTMRAEALSKILFSYQHLMITVCVSVVFKLVVLMECSHPEHKPCLTDCYYLTIRR